MIIEKWVSDLIEEDMRSLPFVQWDRFYANDYGVVVFGWIEREKDSYKDFVVLDYNKKDDNSCDLGWHTSSAKYSRIICDILSGADSPHADCQRVEWMFNIPNMIKL